MAGQSLKLRGLIFCFQAEDGIRYWSVTGVQTCALPIYERAGQVNGQCHGAYSGVVTLHGRSYVASFAPLEDLTGTFVGALSVAIPLDSVLAPSVQLSVLLVLVGLLVGLAGTSGVSWPFVSPSARDSASP